MVGLAVGYRSRAWVTFGSPIRVDEYNPESRRDVLDLAHRTRDEIGRLYKVLPTAIVAAAMHPSISKKDLEARIDPLLEKLRRAGANLGVDNAREAADEGLALLRKRHVITFERGRYRVRDRSVLRYYARTISHLLPPEA
jgi:hypothetical protein